MSEDLFAILRDIEGNVASERLAHLPGGTTPAVAWCACERGDWLVGLIGQLYLRGRVTRHTLVIAACAAARTAPIQDPAGEASVRRAIEAAERWAHGEAAEAPVRSAVADLRAFIRAARADTGSVSADHAAAVSADWAVRVADDQCPSPEEAPLQVVYAAAYAAARVAAKATKAAYDDDDDESYAACAEGAALPGAEDFLRHDATYARNRAVLAAVGDARKTHCAAVADAVRRAVPWHSIETALCGCQERGS